MIKITSWRDWETILRKVFNYFGLQFGWLACALGAARGSAWIGPLVVLAYLMIHLLWSQKRKQELSFVILVGLLGMVVDSLKKASGLITYASDIPLQWLAPPWIIAMWLLFSTSLNGSLVWLQGRYLIAALMGAIFGPLSYVTGERLAAIELNGGLLLSIIILALVWGAAVPFLAWLAKRMVTGEPAIKLE